jgi:hypothetical protein
MTETTMRMQDFVEQYIVYPWETFRMIDILDWLLMTLLFYCVYMLFRGRVAARMGGGLIAILLSLWWLSSCICRASIPSWPP